MGDREGLYFVAFGQPVAKGNLSRNRAGASYDRTKGLRGWTRAVQYSCKQAMPAYAWDLVRTKAPLFVRLEFSLERGKRVRRPWPAVKPDIDKLTRAVLDALTGIAYADDALVCSLEVLKSYADDGARPACRVTICELEETNGD